MRFLTWTIVGAYVLALAGCETAPSKTVQGAAAGGVLGAGTGAIIGHQTGRAGEGAAIGAGVGAIGGGLMGSALDAQDRKIEQGSTAANPIKFCPAGGETYTDPRMRYCPVHGVELRYKD